MPQHPHPPKPFPTISLETLPLDSIRNLFDGPEPHKFRSLCNILASMAVWRREDALTMLFGLAYRNRHNLDRMLMLVEAIRSLDHPEVVSFLASEFTRVPSTPQSRTYLRTVLDALFVFATPECREALTALAHDPRVGTKFRKHIADHLAYDPRY